MKVFSQFSTPAVSRQHLRLTGGLFLNCSLCFVVCLCVCCYCSVMETRDFVEFLGFKILGKSLEFLGFHVLYLHTGPGGMEVLGEFYATTHV